MHEVFCCFAASLIRWVASMGEEQTSGLNFLACKYSRLLGNNIHSSWKNICRKSCYCFYMSMCLSWLGPQVSSTKPWLHLRYLHLDHPPPVQNYWSFSKFQIAEPNQLRRLRPPPSRQKDTYPESIGHSAHWAFFAQDILPCCSDPLS